MDKVDWMYETLKYAVGKNIQDGYVSPSDFNNRLMPMAQGSYQDYLLGQYQRYQAGRPIAVVEFGQNQRIRQSIAPLIYNTVLSPNVTTGIAPFPSDHEYVDAMWSLYGFNRIRFIEQDRLYSVHSSVIDPVATNPVFMLREEGFWFDPVNIGSARLSYVRKCPPIFWGYDEDANGIPVYNPAKSQQPVWGDTDIYQILIRALALVGVNLQLNVVMAYANEIKERGQ